MHNNSVAYSELFINIIDLSPPNLFKVANHIVCQCLHRWQTDLRVTLSALELSGSLAKVEIENAGKPWVSMLTMF